MTKKGEVVVVAASSDLDLGGLTFVSPTRLAAHLIMAHENAPSNLPRFPEFSVEALSRLEPKYLRAVAAKTIEERKGSSASH